MITSVLKDYNDIYSLYNKIGRSYVIDDINEQDKNGFFDRKLWDYFSSHGINGLSVSTAYKGKGYSALKTCVAFEALANGCKNNGLIFSSIAHLLACVVPIDRHGSDKLKQRYLEKLSTGKQIAANGITEVEAGSDVYKMSSTALVNSDTYILNGQKNYITNAPISDVLLLYVSTDPAKGFFGGISCFIVESDNSKIQITKAADKMGLKSAQMGNINFKDLALNADNMVGKPGAGGMIFSESMMWERVVVSAMLIGQLERLFNQTIAYSKTRKLAKRPLMDIQNVRHVLADVKMILYASKNMVYDAAYAIDIKSKEALSKSSAVKLFVSENTVNSIKQLQLIHGAYGYLVESDLEREYRDAYASLIYSGTSAIQRNIISSAF